MKNVLMLLALVVMTSMAIADIGPVARSTSLDATGTVQAGSQEKFYVYVKNSHSAVISDGMVTVLDTADDDGYSVTLSTTAGDFPICVMAKENGSGCEIGALCRCQTYGLNDGVVFNVSPFVASVGHQAFLSETTAGNVQATSMGTVDATDIPIGQFQDTATSSGDVQLFIRLR